MARSEKPWQSIPARGAATALPAVLRLVEGPSPGPRFKKITDGTRTLVHAARSRVYMDRTAWEALTRPDDVYVLRTGYPGRPEYTIALTKTELEDVFGSVRDTRSWDEARCYHFPVEPPAVRAFQVHVGMAPRPSVELPAPPARTPVPPATSGARDVLEREANVPRPALSPAAPPPATAGPPATATPRPTAQQVAPPPSPKAPLAAPPSRTTFQPTSFSTLPPISPAPGDDGTRPPPVPSSGASTWLDVIQDLGYRRVLEHIEIHGHVTEEEVVRMVGGSRARRFSGALDQLLPVTASFTVRVKVVGMTKRYVRENR